MFHSVPFGSIRFHSVVLRQICLKCFYKRCIYIFEIVFLQGIYRFRSWYKANLTFLILIWNLMFCVTLFYGLFSGVLKIIKILKFFWIKLLSIKYYYFFQYLINRYIDICINDWISEKKDVKNTVYFRKSLNIWKMYHEEIGDQKEIGFQNKIGYQKKS